jgi:hypothetical protein
MCETNVTSNQLSIKSYYQEKIQARIQDLCQPLKLLVANFVNS